VKKTLIVVLGPTASGKTALSIALARKYKTEIVSADSRQVFREMTIGTARPTEQEWDGVQHHLLGHLSIHDNYNAALYERDATKILNAIFEKHDNAIVCGGTGLYIKALLEGFDEVPPADETIRQQLETDLSEKGIEYLQEELKKRDPDFFAIAEIQNPQRLMRAIEMVMVSGKTHTELRKGKKKTLPWIVRKIGIDLPREELYMRINRRVDEMMQNGLLEEAKTLFPYKHLNALQTVGYTELFDHLEGKIDLEKAVELIKQHTRNYAKRQLTWFRRDEEIIWVKPGVVPDLGIE